MILILNKNYMARFSTKDTNVILVPTTGTGVVLDLTFVILIGSSVPNTGTGVVLDLTFEILIGSNVSMRNWGGTRYNICNIDRKQCSQYMNWGGS